MPIQQVSFQNNSITKQNQQQQNVVISPVAANSIGDTVEISTKKKENKVLKYALIGVGALLGIVAIVKHKSIAKIFKKPSELIPENTNIAKDAVKEEKVSSNVSQSSPNITKSSSSQKKNATTSIERKKETITKPTIHGQSPKTSTKNENTIHSENSTPAPNARVTAIVKNIEDDITDKAKRILKNANVPEFYFEDLLPSINENNIDALPKILEILNKNDKVYGSYIKNFLSIYSPKNKQAGLKLLDVVNNTKQDFAGVNYLTITDDKLKAPVFHIEKYIKNANETNVEKLSEIIDTIAKRNDVICPQLTINKVYNSTSAENADLLLRVLNEKNISNNQFRFSPEQFSQIITNVGENNNLCPALKKLLNAVTEDGKFALSASEITNVIKKLNDDTLPIFEKICNARFGSKNDCSYSINDVYNIFSKIGDNSSSFENAFDIAIKNGDHLQKSGVSMGWTIENVNKNNIDVFPLLLKMEDQWGNRRFGEFQLNELLFVLKDHPNIELLCKDSNKLEQFLKDFEDMSKLKTKSNETIFLPSPTRNTTGLKKLLLLKYTDIDKYNQMMDLVKLTQEEKIPLYMLEKLSASGDFSPLVMSDIQKIQRGESIIPKFTSDISTSEILNKTKLADVISHNDQLFINEGNKLIPMNMTEETYLKLFPPVERFACSQGSNIGDCRFISGGINNSMINPRARIKLYKMFEQDGNDIIVTIPRYKDQPTRFMNSEINLSQSGKNIEGALGLKMIEQSHARGKWLSEGNSQNATLEEIMQSIDNGGKYRTISGVEETSITLPAYKDEVGWSPFEIPPLEETLSKYSDKNQYLLSAGTKNSDKKIETPQDIEYNLFSNHAYSICDINSKEKTITVSNPWNTAEWIKMSWDKFKENFTQLYVEKM